MITRTTSSIEKNTSSVQQWTGRPTVPFYRPRTRSTPIRKELVEKLRAEIATGNYDTPERLEAALARMFERLNIA